ncbi:HNH endonuclease signature motif containing protein [Pseudarthrobacter sp. NS4]|uniref:HNH endonuclease signature motif containing protein n=1 Tax=Pseudarthrobacter sp. NS4 TaxID=2973976 RepID=UPI002162D950|nr:DUF222 domain-containing protein [Pseudarthrobacter sp. NS4]
MEMNPVVVEAEEAVEASVAAFAAVLTGREVAPSGAAGGPDEGAGCWAAVGTNDGLQRLADGALDVLAGVARSEAKLAAVKAQAVAVLAEATRSLNSPARSPQEATAQERSLVAEVGCVLAIGDRAAGALLGESHALTTSLPRTLAALQAGTISWQHARTMVEQTLSLGPAAAAALEAHFLDPEAPNAARGCPVGQMPAYRFKAKARIWRERHHPESLEKRHARSVADRRVEHCPDHDGMAWISACLPAVTAEAIWNRLTALSRGMQGPDEHRTLSQLRADEFSSTLLTGANNTGGNNTGGNNARAAAAGANADGDGGGGECAGPGGSSSIRPQVLVTVPVFSLLGLTDESATLDGYGPIPASMARDLVAGGADSFHRVLVDPRDGAPLEIGRTSYRVTKAMRNWLQMRDGKCPFPGCSNHSLDNDADHLLAWHKGGTTGISNLGQPCPKHHKLRHTSAWKPTRTTKNEPPGWISPMGRHYKSEHQDWEPPHWPDEILDRIELQQPGGIRPADEEPLPQQQAPLDPLPELAWLHQPLDEPEPDPYSYPPDYWPRDKDQLPDQSLPQDPFPDWELFLTLESAVPV